MTDQFSHNRAGRVVSQKLENNFDGLLDPYLDELLARLGEGLHGIYSHCPGYNAAALGDVLPEVRLAARDQKEDDEERASHRISTPTG